MTYLLCVLCARYEKTGEQDRKVPGLEQAFQKQNGSIIHLLHKSERKIVSETGRNYVFAMLCSIYHRHRIGEKISYRNILDKLLPFRKYMLIIFFKLEITLSLFPLKFSLNLLLFRVCPISHQIALFVASKRSHLYDEMKPIKCLRGLNCV